VVDSTSGLTAAPGTYVVTWDLPEDVEKPNGVNNVTGYWVRAALTVNSGSPTQAKADAVFWGGDIQDVIISNVQAHSNMAATQEYGVTFSGAKRVILTNSIINGETAPIDIGTTDELAGNITAIDNILDGAYVAVYP
jgi:hypothetical protein